LQGTLTASGANSYSWTGGITNAIPFTPLSSTTYTVTGTGVNGCQATATRLITVQVCNYNTQLSPTLCNSININYSQTITATSVLYATNYEFLFAKSDRDNIGAAELQAFRSLAKSYANLSSKLVKALIDDHHFYELIL
jgi:hexokinase